MHVSPEDFYAPGWQVVHAQVDVKPGLLLGYSPVAEGANGGVMIEIDTASATETPYAMLHTDADEIGAWEFPSGPDAPVNRVSKVATPAYKLMAAAGEAEVEI